MRTTDNALRVGAIMALLASGLASCSLIMSLDDLAGHGADASTSDAPLATDAGDAESGAALDGGDVDGAACPGTAGPTGVRVRVTNGTFCIDRTEVTKAQYNDFLRTDPSVASQPPECASNTSFGVLTPPDIPEAPVGDVDWCDARAFCQWAGKRLCGKIGGGPVARADIAAANRSEWMAACSGEATRTYPYAGLSAYQPLACNGKDLDAGTAVPVASLPGCEGGFTGIYDLSGNVSEWEDSCEGLGTATPTCIIRGGDYVEAASHLTCATMWVEPIGYRRDYIGFRCCAP